MLIIPDVHGRPFWKKAVEETNEKEIIFLGDYLDPYPHEGIGPNQSLENFKEILTWRSSVNGKKVIMLIGNHDGAYVSREVEPGSRYSRFIAKEAGRLFEENKEFFSLAYTEKINGKQYLFSHAGLHFDWIDTMFSGADSDRSILESPEKIVNYLNNGLLTDNWLIMGSLNDMSRYRGGFSEFGSIVWSDVNEFFHYKDGKINKVPFDYQIFGHTQMNEYPVITDKFANLDVRRPFILNSDGEILEFDGTKAILWEDLEKQLKEESGE